MEAMRERPGEATERLRARLDELGIGWEDMSSHHETDGTTAHYKRTRIATAAGAVMAAWGYSSLGTGPGERVYAHTLGYPHAIEFWVPDAPMAPVALAPEDAADAAAELHVGAL